MFIRKRVNRTKRYGVSESYQVLESYREGGRVKQRHICNLGRCSTPELALQKARERLEILKKRMGKPVKIGQYSMCGRYRSLKYIRKREEEITTENEREHRNLVAKVKLLEGVVSKMSCWNENLATTN